jgi:hypothetical protein
MLEAPYDQLATSGAAGGLIVSLYVLFSGLAKRGHKGGNGDERCGDHDIRITRLEADTSAQFPRLHRDLDELKAGLRAVHERVDQVLNHLVEARKR